MKRVASRRGDRFDVYDSLVRRDLLEASLALIERSPVALPEPTPSSAVDLLAWLRRPQINAAIPWHLDRLLPDTPDARRDFDGAIGVENQVIWWAFLESADEAVDQADPSVAVRVEGTSEVLIRLPLSEFLLRVLLNPDWFPVALRCEQPIDLAPYAVLPDRVVRGYTVGWCDRFAGSGWLRYRDHFLCDSADDFLQDWSHLGASWEQRSSERIYEPPPAVPVGELMQRHHAYRNLGGWRTVHRWEPVEMPGTDRRFDTS